MNVLRCCSGKLFINRYGGERPPSSCRDIVFYKPEFGFSSSQKLMEFGYFRFKTHPHKPVFAVSTKAQPDIAMAGNKVEETNSLKTVHVKFSLQKECLFGEQFLVVGNDPMLGSWDPASAVPLNWSDGHVWTVELDVPAEKEIRYKFILQGINGEITWQRDPDRLVNTWETNNIIAVIDDWENIELQKIMEEEPHNFSEGVAENFVERREQFVSNVTNGSLIGNNHSLTEAISPAEELEDLLIANNIAASNENTVLNTEDNISQTKGQAAEVETRKEEESRVAYIMEQNGTVPKESMNGVHDVIDNVRITTDGLGITFVSKDALINEEGAVLVPGLSNLSMEVTDKPMQHEENKSHGIDASSTGLDEAIEPKVPESNVKQETDNAIHQEEKAFLQLYQEEPLDNEETIPMSEDEAEKKPEAVNSVLRNDAEWGYRTLQKFLNILGLL